MRIGFPHCGHAYIVAQALVQKLDTGQSELIVPPPTSHRTLDLGVKYSPVEACLPFKLTLGNLIEACELGADTLIHARGTGVCRLGYYVREQEQIIHDLGYDAHFLTLDVSQHRFKSIMHLVREVTNDAPWPRIISAIRFSITKLFACDNIDKVVHKARAVELDKGMTNRIYREAINAISEARTTPEVKKVAKDYTTRLNQIRKDPHADPVKVGIVGEVYVVLDPFANMDIEMELGKLGVEVERTLSLSRWVKYRLFLNYLGADEWKGVHKLAMPYLKRNVGGEGWESVGEKILYGQNGFDGLVHLAPFTCMPEIVAQNIMPSTREDIPVLTVLYDEQMARPGMITRLEAFVDLLKFRRKRRRQ
jgi:predicted nucleotide-binding protein (sugar kinase/HSP70/actin superfamily)